MGPHYLNHFFAPESVAVIGASDRKSSVGKRLFENMQEAGFSENLYPVNRKHKTIGGLKAYSSVENIPVQVDLAVIATPAPTVPEIVHQCGEKAIDSVIIISAGFGEIGPQGKRLEKKVTQIAHNYGIRIIGPNCLGLIRPKSKVNATFGYGKVKGGNLALVSQSGAVCTAILDWAISQDIGFSTVVSMGAAADLDFGEILDFLMMDAQTKGILLYVEGVKEARRFLSGLKAAARLKPVILIKSGRHEAGSKAAMSHTGAIVGSDDVFDAAIERAGVVRAYSINQLFSAARVLAAGYEVNGDRLAIITNAGGPGVMSTDRAEDVGVSIAKLSEASLEQLNAVMPVHWSQGNPIDILGDATSERYEQALKVCLEDKNIDGVLTILTPQAMTQPTKVAQHVIKIAKKSNKPVLASWTGGSRVTRGRKLFAGSNISHFSTPEIGVIAFSFLAQYRKNQKLLKQIPAPNKEYPEPDIDGGRLIIERVLAESRQTLTSQEAKAILAAFNIPVTQTIIVSNTKEAMVAAETLGFPIVLKINMAEFSHKSDVGGVRLNISNARDVSFQFQEMESIIKKNFPEVQRVEMTVESMYQSYNGRELMIGVIRDPVFGPAISFGLGGTMVEIILDRAIGLPPLNEYMVEQMIAKTKAAKYLTQFRQMPAVHRKALIEVMLNVSTMVSELPEILELDINPLIADDRGVMAVDARIKAHVPHQLIPYSHMAIHPYPHELISHYQLPNGTNITIRPIKPEDADIEKDFIRRLSDQSKYFRFMQALQELTPEMVVRFTQIDYDREMAFIAVTERETEKIELAVGRYMINPDANSAEFALVVADECQGMGIGTRIMRSLMQVAKHKGINTFDAEILRANKPMLSLMKKLGFNIETVEGDSEIVRVEKDLRL